MTARPQNGLMTVERARAFLAQCRDVDEVKKIRDQAVAVAAYLRAHEAAEGSALDATVIARRSERRLGELVAELPKAKPPGKKKIGSSVRPISETPTLADHGITKSDSSRWQAIAAVPEKKFEATIAQAIEAKKPPTASALVRLGREVRSPKEKEPTAFHAIVALGDLKDRLAGIIRSTVREWPSGALADVGPMLRDLASDLEKELSC